MALLRVSWTGKVVSVNKRTGARVFVPKGFNKNMPVGAVLKRRAVRAMVYQSDAYKKFKESIAAVIPPVKIDGYVDLKITASLWKVADTDNIIKPVQDALQLSGVIENDKFIRDILIKRKYHKKGEEDEIEIVLYKANI